MVGPHESIHIFGGPSFKDEYYLEISKEEKGLTTPAKLINNVKNVKLSLME
jgi:hypothetical protein